MSSLSHEHLDMMRKLKDMIIRKPTSAPLSDETRTHSSRWEFLAEGESSTSALGALEDLWTMVVEDAQW